MKNNFRSILYKRYLACDPTAIPRQLGVRWRRRDFLWSVTQEIDGVTSQKYEGLKGDRGKGGGGRGGKRKKEGEWKWCFFHLWNKGRSDLVFSKCAVVHLMINKLRARYINAIFDLLQNRLGSLPFDWLRDTCQRHNLHRKRVSAGDNWRYLLWDTL